MVCDLNLNSFVSIWYTIGTGVQRVLDSLLCLTHKTTVETL